MSGSVKRFSVIVLALIMCASCFAGCVKKDKDNGHSKSSKTYRYVVLDKRDEVSKESLGDIRTDGDFNECSSKNMLDYKGYYKGLDYVTLVFDSSSPVGKENVDLFISEEIWINCYLEGLLYREKGGNKYITFKFETCDLQYPGHVEQFNSAKNCRYFELPTEASEPMSHYFILIDSRWGDNDASIGECRQKEAVDQGYWTDYIYDKTAQYYYADSGKWESEISTGLMTNNMPLE